MRQTTLLFCRIPFSSRKGFLLTCFLFSCFVQWAQVVCAGATLQLNGTGNPALTTPWVSSNPTIAGISGTGLVSGLTAGTATITYTDEFGAATLFTITVPSNANPTITLTSPSYTTSQFLTSPSYIGGVYVYQTFVPITYAISPGCTASVLNPASLPTGVTTSFSNGVFTIGGLPTMASLPTMPITFSYTVVVTPLYPCSANGPNVLATGSITLGPNCINLPSGLTSAPGTGNQTICLGSPIQPIQYSGGVVYYDGVLPAGITQTGNSMLINLQGTPQAAGVYTYLIYVTSSCGAFYQLNGSITVKSLPVTPTVSAGGPTALCQGQQVTLTSSAATGNLWSPGGQTTQSITVSAAGNYSTTITANGCSSTSLPKTVTVTPLPAIPVITASGPLTFCQGNTVTLTSSAASGNTWSTGESTQSITVSTPGNYSVTVTTNGCSSTSLPKTVTVTPLPDVPVITASGPLTFCEGGSVTLTSSANTGNLWSNGQTTQSITVSGSDSYSVTVTTNGCSSTSLPKIVAITPLPDVPVITASGPLTFCEGGSVTLTSSANTGNLWSNGQTTQSITVSTPGNYSVTVTTNGCSSTSLPKIVAITPLPAVPVITASGPLTFCQGGSVTLTSSANAGNLWSNGQTNPSITVTESGNYSVTVTENGCPAASVNTLVLVDLPLAPPDIIPNGPLSFCEGGSVTLLASVGSGITWSTGETTQAIVVYTSGNYFATTSAGSCSATSATVSVQVHTFPPVPVISASGPLTFCEGGSVTLTSSANTGNLWTNGQTSPSITVTESGNYSVTVTENGCSAASGNTVILVDLPLAPPDIIPNGPLSFCEGGSVTLLASVGSGITWSTGETTQTIIVYTSGNYFATTSAGSCSATSATVSIQVNTFPPVPVISASGPLTFCEGGSVTLTSSVNAGNLWPNGETTPSIVVSATGNYSVTAGTNGCTTTSEPVTVAELSDPIVSIGEFDPVCSHMAPFTLSSGVPENGVYSVNGIAGSAFNPATAAIGTNTVIYTYEDSSGCSSAATTTITVEDCALVPENDQLFFRVFPNPATGSVTISGNTTRMVSLELSDLTGRIVLSLPFFHAETTLDVSALEKGRYTVVVRELNSGASQTTALILY